MSRRSNRRDFLKQTAMAGVGFWVAGGISLAADDKKSPNESLNLAGVGIGGKGSSDISQASKFGNVVALCDIDDNLLNNKAKEFPKAEKFNDFREMLEKKGKDIDAVVVGTPDHTHAVICMMAMKMKKHVYCQKPLTHSVHEARLLRDTARKMGVCTQMGNQGSAADGIRQGVEIVQSGAIGKVTEVHVWTDRPREFWKQAPDIVKRPPAQECPKHIHWELFLGPAPERPFNSAYHPMKWRGFWDFGTGAMGDMACHTANLPFRALKLGYPTSIVAESGEINPETYPAWAKITYQFPARGDMPALKFIWYEGKKDGQKLSPPAELTKGLPIGGSGSLMIGDKGTMFSGSDYGDSYKLSPEKDFKGYKPPEHTIPRIGGGDLDTNMKAEWVLAIKKNRPETAYSNFDFAAAMTEAMLIGNVAVRLGKKLEYDSEQMKATNCPEADQYIKPEYRKGWSL